MHRVRGREHEDHQIRGGDAAREPVPGRCTLTQRIAGGPASSQADAAPVQRQVDAGARSGQAQLAEDLAAAMGFFGGPADTIDASVARRNAEPVQRAAGGAVGAESTAPASGSGRAIPDDVRTKMEDSFGTDFSAVRVHEGPQAAAIGALAYTQGTDLHFAPGQYQPSSLAGQELLGHELAHVVQQAQGRVQTTTQAKGVGINDDAGLEHEADTMGARAARGEPARMAGAAVAQRRPSQPVQRMKVRGTTQASEMSGDKLAKHVVASGDQAAAAKAAYADSTFVTSAAAITSVVDGNDHNFTEENGAASARFDFDANVTITMWRKTDGVGVEKPVAKHIDNASTLCEIGVKKNGVDKLQVTHFMKK